MYDGLKSLNDKMVAARKQLEADGELNLKAAFREFFEKHPEVKEVVWNQYTPYFNDGETCTFGVNDWALKIDGVKSTDKYSDDTDYVGPYDMREAIGLTPNTSAVLKQDVSALFDLAGNEVMELVFGDHAKVVASPDGFNVEEYEHD